MAAIIVHFFRLNFQNTATGLNLKLCMFYYCMVIYHFYDSLNFKHICRKLCAFFVVAETVFYLKRNQTRFNIGVKGKFVIKNIRNHWIITTKAVYGTLESCDILCTIVYYGLGLVVEYLHLQLKNSTCTKHYLYIMFFVHMYIIYMCTKNMKAREKKLLKSTTWLKV